MRNHGVVVRFISLLDVTLVLVGVLLLSLSQISKGHDDAQDVLAAEVQGKQNSGQNISFIYLYGGWNEDEKNKVYLLDDNMELSQEMDTKSPHDIDRIIESRTSGNDKKSTILVLIVSRMGWYGNSFGEMQVREIEKTWNSNKKPDTKLSINRVTLDFGRKQTP